MKIIDIKYAALLIIISVSGYAAEVNKEVEVTRAYVPEVKVATKLHLTPDMSDDSYIKPDIDYSITPISIETKMETKLYRTVNINLEDYEPQSQYYTKLGVGAPFQSVVDLYAAPIVTNEGYIVGYFNQAGRFANIDNIYGASQDAAQNHLRGGVAVAKQLLDRTLDGSVNYTNDKWSRYATDGEVDQHPLYQSITLRGRYGDGFTALERFNFAIDGGVEHFWSRSDYRTSRCDIGALVGREIAGGDVIVGGGFESIWGSEEYTNRTVDFAASYGVSGESWGAKVGLKYYNDRVGYDPNKVSYVALLNGVSNGSNGSNGSNVGNYVTPDVEVSYNISGRKVVGYFKADGELQHHDFATLSRENPYLIAGLFAAESGVKYSNMVGVKGSLASGRFGYNVYAGYEAVKNNMYWALVESNMGSSAENYFVASYSTQHSFSFNSDVEYQPNSELNLWAAFSASSYDNDKEQIMADGESTVELRLGAKYRVAKWRFGVDGELLSSREYTLFSGQHNWSSSDRVEIPATFDLGLSVEYRFKRSMLFFAEVNNLFNDDLYRWVGYREYGINAMAGIKMEF